MYFVYAVVLALCALPNVPAPLLPARLRGRLPTLVALAVAVLAFLVPLFIDAATAERVAGGYALPFAVVSVAGTVHPLASDVAGLCGVIQTLALAVLALAPAAVRDDRVVRGALVAAALACAGAGAVTAVVRSPDLYAYAGYTLLARPYEAQTVPFGANAAPVAALWHFPIVPPVYGPLWIFGAKLLAAPATSLLARLYVLRAIAILAFAACAALYARQRNAYYALALVACNGALLDAFVVDGHNDAAGVAFLLAAMLPACPFAFRIAAVALAAAVKLPLAIAGWPLFERGNVAARALAATLATAVAAGATIVAGVPLLRTVFAQQRDTIVDGGIVLGHAVALGAFAGVFALALLARRYLRFGGLLTLAFGLSPFPWYLIWGLPYALAAGSDLAFLTVLPAIASFADSSHDVTPVRLAVAFAAFVALAAFALREWLRRLRPAA